MDSLDGNMKIGILSDTHGNEELMELAALMLRDKFSVDRLWHLGDNEGDGEKLEAYGLPTTAVPGIYDSNYRSEGNSCAHLESIEGFDLVALHDLRDLGKLRGRRFDIVLHGHAHVPTLSMNLGKLFINPGHLKAEIDRGNAPSCALLVIEKGVARAVLLDIAGEIIEEVEFVPSGDEGEF